MSATWRSFIGPALLVVVAAVLVMKPVPLYLATTSDIISLEKSHPNVLSFRTGPAGGYDAFIQLDRAAFEATYPCQPHQTGRQDCPTEILPLSVTATVEGPSGVVWRNDIDTYVPGDRFISDAAVATRIAGWALAGDTDYRLTVVSRTDGKTLSAASPRLSVDLGPFERESEAFAIGAPRFYAIALVALALLWCAVALFARAARRRPAPGP